LRIIIENGQERGGQNAASSNATFFDPGRSAAINAGPAPPTSPGMSTTARSVQQNRTKLIDAIPGAKVLNAGPPAKSLLELVKSATSGMGFSSAYEKNKNHDIDAGKAPKS
jgi:hypothetical protein